MRSARNARRVVAARRGVVVRVHAQVRFSVLQGMVRDVAGDHRALPLALDDHAHVPGRVPRCGDELHLVAQPVIGLHQVGGTRGDDRSNGLGDVGVVGGAVVVLPSLPLHAPEEVARVRERHRPLAVDETGVPAGVVEVQMCAQDGVDVVDPITGASETVEEPVGGFGLDASTFADARIDQDPAGAGVDHQPMDGHPALPVVVDEVRSQPRCMSLDCARRRGREAHVGDRRLPRARSPW